MSVQTTFSQDLTQGFSGQKVGHGSFDVQAMRNGEASASMAPGIAVKHGSTTDDRDAQLLTAITGENVAGIIIHQHYAEDQLDDDNYIKAGYELAVCRRGRLLVTCEDGCNVGDSLHIRAVAAGAELAGALLAAADGTDTIDCSGYATWRTSAAAGGLAELEFDFSGFPTPA